MLYIFAREFRRHSSVASYPPRPRPDPPPGYQSSLIPPYSEDPLNIQMIPHPLIQDPLYPQKTMILCEFFQRISDFIKYSQFLKKKMLF